MVHPRRYMALYQYNYICTGALGKNEDVFVIRLKIRSVDCLTHFYWNLTIFPVGVQCHSCTDVYESKGHAMDAWYTQEVEA